MKHLDLFSGIGGFALAARMVGGIETHQFVEIDPYCQKVLAKNFKGVPVHGDIRSFTTALGSFDIITGGFPCQDISAANRNGRGLEGERSGLFYELMRVVRECRPRFVVLENVENLLRIDRGRAMGAVLWELSESGFDAEWQVVSASSVGAPHRRERVFIVAYPKSYGNHGISGAMATPPSQAQNDGAFAFGSCSNVTHTHSARREKLDTPGISTRPRQYTRGINTPRNPWTVEPGVRRVADGIPCRVDRIRGLGNAVVPQAAAVALERVIQLWKFMGGEL